MSEFHSFYLTHKRFFDAHRVSEQGALGFLRALSKDPKSSFFTDFSEVAGGCSSFVEAPVHLERKRIQYTVDSFQKAILLKAWGDVYDLEFLNVMKVGHTLPASFRILECEVLLSLCDHSKPIIDSGGNTAYHVKNLRKHLHSCCPLLSVRDHTRMNSRLLEIERIARDKNSRSANFARQVLDDKSYAYCNKLSQDCKVQAKTMLWVHSIYDMRITDLAEQMSSHGTEIGYGVFMYTDAVFGDDKGPLTETAATFEKVGDKIRFFFNRDPSFAYEHSWEGYKEFLVDRVITYRGTAYYYRVYPTNRNSMMFTITRLDSSVIGSSFDKEYIVARSRKPRVLVTVYDVDWSKSHNDKKFVVAREVGVPSEFYHAAMSHCFAKMRDEATTTPLDFNAFYGQCRSLNKYLDINGVVISGAVKVSVDDFNVVCTSLFHLAAMIVAYRRVQTGLVLKDLQKRRMLSDQGFFSNMFRYCKTFLPSMSVFTDLVDNFRMVLLQTVDNKLLSVLVEEEARFQRVNSMSLSDAFEKVTVDLGHSPEVDLSEAWKANDDDLDLIAEILRAEGKPEQADFVERKSSTCKSMSSTCVGSGSVSVKGKEDQDYFEENEPDEVDDTESAELRQQKSGRDHDPGDRDAANCYRIAAIDEYVALNRRTYEKDMGSATAQMRESWNFGQNCPSKQYCDRKVETVEGPNYIEFDGHQMIRSLLPLTCDGYMWGMNPYNGSLVRIMGGMSTERGGVLKARYQGWLFVCSELAVMNGHLIADAIESTVLINGGYGEMPVVHLSSGIAGSGKSTRIRRGHTPQDMIFTATAACKNDMIEALEPGGKDAPEAFDYNTDYMRKHVNTNHSYLIHSSVQSATIRHDEAMLCHVGELYAVAMKCGAKVVHWSGDAVQIPFLNRIESLMKLKYSKIEFFDHYEMWLKSYRMPHDVMKAANTRYYDGLGRTCSKVSQSMTLEKISDSSDPRLAEAMAKADRAMGFYKSEKADLKKRSKRDISKTVHESQGEDHMRTVLVRFNDKDFGGLYTGPKHGGNGHTFVGCTRHKESLQIFHRGPVDELVEIYHAGLEPAPTDSYVFDPELHNELVIYF